MYINKNRHYLSTFLMIVAITNILTMFVTAAGRMLLVRSSAEVAMLNNKVEIMNGVVSLLQILFTIVVFVYFVRKIKHIKRLIPKEDYAELAMLQKEMLGDNVSLLDIDQTDCLIKLWGFILIAMQFIYELSTKVYEKMIMDILVLFQLSGLGSDVFVNMYNSSHGFKYLCMMSAIMIGVYVSGLFLKDKIMINVAFIMLALFMLAFLFINSTSLSMLGRDMEIVWTSVMFHVLETGGLLVTALYIRFRYSGM